MSTPRPRRVWQTGLVLAAIIACGIGLRAFRLGWGLPDYNFPDDVMHFLRPAAVAASDGPLRPGGYVHPPALIVLLEWTFRGWAAATGRELDFRGMRTGAELAPLTMVGRGLIVALAALSIVVVHRVARRLVGARAALLAAAVMALAPLHVLESHRLAPDVPAILLVLVATNVALAGAHAGRPAVVVAAALLAGLAGAVRYTAGIAVAVPAWLVRGRGRRAVVAVGVVALMGFLLGCAPCLCDARRFLGDVKLVTLLGYGAEATGVTLAAGWTQQRFVYPLVVALPYALGWPAYLAALGGLVLLWRHARDAATLLLVVLVPYLLLMGASNTAVPRYYLQLVPFLAIAAGAALDRLWVGRTGRLLALAVVGYTALLSTSQVARLGLGPQGAVGVFVADLAAEVTARGAGPLVVAYPDRIWLHYDAVAQHLRRPDVKIVELPATLTSSLAKPTATPPDAREWLTAHGVDAVIVPSWVENGIRRLARPGPAMGFLEDIGSGRLGFREGLHTRDAYLTETLYTWGDPMLDTHWETGVAGYRVFVRGPR